MLTAMVSPNARPKPRSIAAITLGAEARKTTFFIVSHFVAPMDSEASFKEMGIASKDSMHNDIIMGKTMIERIIAAEKMHSPVLSTPNKGATKSLTNGAKNRKAHSP
jgi:hypothetical protein